MSTTIQAPDQLRQEAITRIQKRSDLWAHLAAYVLINAIIIAVWFYAAGGGFFWPVFPLAGWGIGVFFHAWDVFRRPLTEQRIHREIQRLEGQAKR